MNYCDRSQLKETERTAHGKLNMLLKVDLAQKGNEIFFKKLFNHLNSLCQIATF